MAHKDLLPKASIKGPQELIDGNLEPFEITNAWQDIGLELNVRDVKSIGVFLEVDIGTSTNVRLRATAKVKNELQANIDLYYDIRNKLNAHYADATEHTAGVQAAVTSDAYNLESLIDSVIAIMASYELHDADAELAAAWSYHIAQEAGDNSQADQTAPTTLATCRSRLNALQTAINGHFVDGTSHTTGDSVLSYNSGDVEYVFPIRVVSATEAKITDDYMELDADADQNVMLEVILNKYPAYVQLQIQDSNNGTGQIESAYVNFNRD